MTCKTLGRGGLFCALLLVAGCSSNVDPDIEPVEAAPTAQAPEALPTGPLTAAQISRSLSEKTFGYAAPGRSGTVTYYADGTFSFEENGKGTGTGIWQASDGKLCEAYNPNAFMPRGTPSTCQPISSDGIVFTAGQMRLQPV